jgi:DNA-binding NarL/FixJ family response regulator
MMRILIADDHATMRGGLKRILAEAFPRAAFGETSTTAETLALLDGQPWDLLLLDIFMPHSGGLEVLREAGKRSPRVPVLVLSSAPEEQFAVRMLEAGASGYLNKRAASEELLAAVKKILAGGRHVSDRLAEKLAAYVGRASAALHERLSHREFQVLQMLVAGQSVKEIAVDLNLSAKTVATFRTRVLKKLKLQSDVELVHYAYEERLVEHAGIIASPAS